jgi:hypothetical protein
MKPGFHSVARPGSAAGLSDGGHTFSLVPMISCRPGAGGGRVVMFPSIGLVCRMHGVVRATGLCSIDVGWPVSGEPALELALEPVNVAGVASPDLPGGPLPAE